MISPEDSPPGGPSGSLDTKKSYGHVAAFAVCFRLYRRKGEDAAERSSPGPATAGFEVRI